MSCETLSVYPEEIQFLDVRPNQTYIQTVEVGRASIALGAVSCIRVHAR
jgi:hypothetical protein